MNVVLQPPVPRSIPKSFFLIVIFLILSEKKLFLLDQVFNHAPLSWPGKHFQGFFHIAAPESFFIAFSQGGIPHRACNCKPAEYSGSPHRLRDVHNSADLGYRNSRSFNLFCNRCTATSTCSSGGCQNGRSDTSLFQGLCNPASFLL